MARLLFFVALALLPIAALAGIAGAQKNPAKARTDIYVDGTRGKDSARGSRRAPLKSISAAVARLPEPLQSSVTIHVAGPHTSTGGKGMLADTLELDLRMRPGARVRIVGEKPDFAGAAGAGEVILDWQSSRRPHLVEVTGGHWSLENVQVGNRRPRQRQGISVGAGAELTLVDVRVRVASLSGAGLHAHDGGRLHLEGKIEINEDFHEAIPSPESFAGVYAEDHGLIRFTRGDGSSLSVGNGSLSASYYGVVRLGCESARVTSWGGQSNNIAVNNSGRVDLHGTRTVLRPRQPTNSPIGLEHDGHVLAEGARIVIEGVEDGSGIVLQKASTLYGQDIEWIGPEPRYTLMAYSGSNFSGDFRGKIFDVHATTGSTIAIGGKAELKGPFQVTRGGTLSLPDGRVLRGESR